MKIMPCLICKDNVLSIIGDLTFQTVADLHKQLPDNLNGIIDTVDCQGITHSDSAAVSFLLAIMRACQPQEPKLVNVDHSLSTLAKLYDVDGILFHQ